MRRYSYLGGFCLLYVLVMGPSTPRHHGPKSAVNRPVDGEEVVILWIDILFVPIIGERRRRRALS